jgi:nitrite reductase (NADH) small subunit
MEDILSQYGTVHQNDVKIWFKAGKISDFSTNRGGCIKYKNKQIAVFNFSRRNQWFACQNACPHKMEMVLSRGMLGSADDIPKIACPMHKKTFSGRRFEFKW